MIKKKSQYRINKLAMLVLVSMLILTGCGKKGADKKNTFDLEDIISEENSTNKTKKNKKLSIDDIYGVWQLASSTFAGDPCIYQIEIYEKDRIAYSTYTSSGDNWLEAAYYDVTIEETDEDSDELLNVWLGMYVLDENGTATDQIEGTYTIKYDKDDESITLTLVKGDSLMDDHFYEPVTFTKVDEAVETGGSISDEEHIATEDEIHMLEEAITLFPLYEWGYEEFDGYMAASNALTDWKIFFDNKKNYAGLHFEEGEGKTPIDLTYEGISKGSDATYIRVSKAEIETALRDFFDREPYIGDSGTYNDVVIDDYITVWGHGYIVSYEGFYMGWERFDEHMEGDTLVIEGFRRYVSFDESEDATYKLCFRYNPDSIYNYSLIDCRLVDSETKLNYTQEEITEFEGLIRDYVNNRATNDDKVMLEAGEDGCPYARWYYYDYDGLRFAYYHDSKDGDVDNRYYFVDGRMVEWIEGNGNDDRNRVRHYASDIPLDSRWKETEKKILEEAEEYR